MKTSSRSQIDPFIVMDMMEAACRYEASGRRIVHMEIGQPGSAPPETALDALSKAMKGNVLGYTVALGLPELRKAIAKLYQDWYGLDLDPARIVVTSGASAGFLLAFTALFDAGESVGLGEPCYPSYRHVLRALSLVPSLFQTRAENRFQPSVADLESLSIKGLVVASPANPTGAMLDHDALSLLIKYCESRGIAFISDEIYHGLHYDRAATSALEISDDVWVINSFSKYFSMTGWRVGWMVVPPDYVCCVERLAQNMFICPPHASQFVAHQALGCMEELEEKKRVYTENRRLMLEGLPEAGFCKIAPPDGAFYIYADVSDFTDDSLAFSRRILDEVGVAVTPGIDFDAHRGHRMLRFSYARNSEDIAEGLVRLKAFMKKNSFL